MPKTAVQEIEKHLLYFTGTENYFSNRLLHFVYTDGVKYLWENCEAYWLLIAIASYKTRQDFQVWTLKVNEDHSAVLSMREDKDTPELVHQDIEYTDFPLPEIKLFMAPGGLKGEHVLFLPSEY